MIKLRANIIWLRSGEAPSLVMFLFDISKVCQQ